MTEASDFKFGTQLGFAKAHDKIPHPRKSGRDPVLLELPKILGFPFNICSNLACNWGSPRPTIKTTTRRKSERGFGVGKLSNIWGSPLIFLQRTRCPLSISGTSCLVRNNFIHTVRLLTMVFHWLMSSQVAISKHCGNRTGFTSRKL